MALKTIPSKSGRKTRRAPTPPVVVGEPTSDLPRRDRRPKLHETVEATTCLAEQVFDRGEEPAKAAGPLLEARSGKTRRARKLRFQSEPALSTDFQEHASGVLAVGHERPAPAAESPAQARRRRKPKARPTPDMPATDDDHAAAIVAELEQAEPGASAEALGASNSGSPAAHWDAATGSVTFH